MLLFIPLLIFNLIIALPGLLWIIIYGSLQKPDMFSRPPVLHLNKISGIYILFHLGASLLEFLMIQMAMLFPARLKSGILFSLQGICHPLLFSGIVIAASLLLTAVSVYFYYQRGRIFFIAAGCGISSVLNIYAGMTMIKIIAGRLMKF